VTHTISFDVNGGTGSVSSLQVTYGQASSALPGGTGLTAPTGKKFDSWNTKADGTGTKYASGATVANVTADMALYAQYVTDSSSGGGSSHSGGSSSSASASTSIKIVTDKETKEAVISFSSSSAKVTAAQIKDVITSNKDNNVVIKQNDFTMTFKKGTMQEVSGKTEYDFGVSFGTGTLKDTTKKAAGDSFIQSLHFNYSGQLPAKATIDINLGKAYSGQTLNYNYYDPQTGKLEFKQKSTVDSNGIFTVQQSSCSDYVITKDVSATPGKLNLNVESWVNPFTDVAKSDWFYKSVAILNQNNIMGGTDASAFSPNLGTNRAMIATILYRLDGSKETFDSSFTDVTKDKYYANAVAWAQNKGIVTGYGNNIFAPNNNITREQLVSILWRYAGSPVVTDYNGIASFKDAFDISDYAKQAFAWAYQQKIISGKGDNSLDPKGLATRAEVAMMITSYAEK
ncbi:S-layer homology domain-containing protein, partial [Aminipila sp.]|uniref:S-layer homology domain-containing protein n=1 Tax=Aminipila sp. TaxID=2060095 RepID=UPI0028A126AA